MDIFFNRFIFLSAWSFLALTLEKLAVNPQARQEAFNIGWAFGRIGQLLEKQGTQNAKGEWRVVEFINPLGPKIDKPRSTNA